MHDPAVIERIILAINPQQGDLLFEIGPGQGAITLPLLARHGQISAIELDRDLITSLRENAASIGQLRLYHANILDLDLSSLTDGTSPIRLIGNLPYNISTPILFHALDHAAIIRDMHFMLQKEVVDRMAAGPGSKVYGRLSVMLQAYCQVVPLFDVPPCAFRPPPRVNSTVVRITPRNHQEINIAHRACFARIVAAAFAQRRKTLRNALRAQCDDSQLLSAGISPEARAETIEVAQFIRLANQLSTS